MKTQDLFSSIPKELEKTFSALEFPWEILKGPLKDFFKNQPKENKILGDVSSKAIIEGHGIYIAPSVKIEATAFIKGPCYIDEGTEIRHGAYLRGDVFIGKNCVVGHATEVKHSLFFDGAKAGHFNYVGDSILGNNVNLGAGTKIANLKVIPGTIVLKIGEQTIDTGLRKFGALLGDGVETGCNSVLNPGTILAPKSIVFPNTSAFGVHRKKIKIK